VRSGARRGTTLAAASRVLSPLRFRLVTCGVVAALVAASHLALPEPTARSEAQLLFVLALGYGHLLGAVFGGSRGVRFPGLVGAFGWASAATGLVLYREALVAWPGVAVLLLALSVWHFTENDVALAAALRTGRALGPLPWSLRAQALPVAAAAAVVAVAAAAWPDSGRLGDLFAVTTLFHLIGWLVFLAVRGTRPGRLLALHAPGFALAGALLAVPGAAPWLREWLFAPALYLYWASLHVVQTLVRRRGSRSPWPLSSTT
jgi:hypothetical protein